MSPYVGWIVLGGLLSISLATNVIGFWLWRQLVRASQACSACFAKQFFASGDRDYVTTNEPDDPRSIDALPAEVRGHLTAKVADGKLPWKVYALHTCVLCPTCKGKEDSKVREHGRAEEAR